MTTDTQHGVARKSKRIRLDETEKVFVGADVHRKTYAIALWSTSRDLIDHWTQPADPAVLARRLESIRGQVQRVVYEAGPTGYSLVRTLRAAGFAADVIVTSQMLRTTVAGAMRSEEHQARLATIPPEFRRFFRAAFLGGLKDDRRPVPPFDQSRGAVAGRRGAPADQVRRRSNSQRLPIKSAVASRGGTACRTCSGLEKA